MKRTISQTDKICSFYQDGELVGQIDFSDKSIYFIEDAITNWMDGIMTVETVEHYSINRK